MRISETEAYIDLEDPVCHSQVGTRIDRTEIMYEQDLNKGGINFACCAVFDRSNAKFIPVALDRLY